MLKNVFFTAFLFLFVFTGCENKATSKINDLNVANASTRDASYSALFPTMKLEKELHNFGNIEYGKPVEAKFKYTNTGNSILVITNIESTCGCTVPKDYSKELKPGETGEFTVKFNGNGKGKVVKSLTLKNNTEKGSEVVKIQAFVEGAPENNKGLTK